MLALSTNHDAMMAAASTQVRGILIRAEDGVDWKARKAKKFLIDEKYRRSPAVVFSEQSTKVVVVPARSDLSVEEVNATWISQNERTDSAKEVAETVQLLRDINIYDERGHRVGSMVSYDQTKYCERGLETFWPKWKAARDNRRRNCFNAVLSAQDQQRDQGKQCDKILANASCNISRESAKQARIRAKADLMEAKSRQSTNSLPRQREPRRSIILNSANGKELAARHARERQEFALKAFGTKIHLESAARANHRVLAKSKIGISYTDLSAPVPVGGSQSNETILSLQIYIFFVLLSTIIQSA